MSGTCSLEVKTLKGEKIILEDISIELTVQDLYGRVAALETTPKGKWKLMVITTSGRTLKPSDGDKLLKEYGVKTEQQYRVEVILDMGACHTICKH